MALSEFAPPARFRVVRRLGEGGMGVVYEAHDVERGVRVALKTLLRATPDSLHRLKREFRALQDFHHPNLVSLGELISEGDTWFFTMELVLGVPFLDYLLNEGPPSASSGVREVAQVSSSDSVALDATKPFVRDSQPDIAPQSFPAPPVLTHVACDVARLRDALGQLAQGLAALHVAGKVHRDIKPSNVLVTPQGRVVLLDFGLVADTDARHDSTGHQLVGTPGYMAPEQAAGTVLGPEADWYSVGVLLYEALTGRLPFEGTSLQMMIRKQHELPKLPSARVKGVPADLEAFCMRLLHFDPTKRPRAAEVLRALRVGDATTSRVSASLTLTPPFVGRASELEVLRAAYADVRDEAKAVTVLVSGASGMGKSCLVRHFVDALDADRAMVLVGRCYEREAVPYKALDGVVDALGRRLARMKDADAASYLPRRVGALAQVFPALRHVAAVSREPLPAETKALDPYELRQRAFAALREMLTRLGDRQPLVLVIDDLQWADADSLALIAEILRPPSQPALLLLATVRQAPSSTGPETMRSINITPLEEAIPGDVRKIQLARLSDEDARDLATKLLGRVAPEKVGAAAAVAQESAGHPMFIDELVRHAALVSGEHEALPGALKLDEALWTRVARLDEPARAVMELVATAGMPMPQDVLAQATRIDDFARTVSMLRVAHLVRTTGARAADAIEPYHDRVREAVLRHLDAPRRKACHERLAVALEGSRSPDAEALATHWRGAGDGARASKYAVAAGEQAMEALAFERAARWYQRALELAQEDERRALRVRLGDALAQAGRGALAAAQYEEAAREGPQGEALDLRRRAAEQLLRSGHFDRGMSVARAVLQTLGMDLPSSARVALVWLLFFRAVLFFRGFRFVERDSSQVAARDLTRIDTCWSMSFALALSDHIYGALFQVRTLLLALRSGEPSRVARMVSLEVGFTATRGGPTWPRVEQLLARADALVRSTGDSHARGQFMTARGLAYYLNGRFEEARESLEGADQIIREEVRGAAWELGTVRAFALNSLVYLGALRELCERQSAFVREATERGDVYATVIMRIGLPNLVWLVSDEPDWAQRQLGAAMGQWSKGGFHLEHFYALLARVNIALYAGRADEGLDAIEEHAAPLRRSLLLRIQTVRILIAHLRARVALAGAEGAPKERRDRLLAAAERDARRIAREGMVWSDPLATLLRAGIAAFRGDRALAERALREAALAFDEAKMALFSVIARRRLGELLANDEGAKLTADADAWFAEQRVKRPERFTAMFAPGFGPRTAP